MHTLEQLTTSLVSQEDKEEDDGVVVNKVQSEASARFNDPFFSSTATVIFFKCESLHWLICKAKLNPLFGLCSKPERKTKNCLAWKEKMQKSAM